MSPLLFDSKAHALSIDCLPDEYLLRFRGQILLLTEDTKMDVWSEKNKKWEIMPRFWWEYMNGVLGGGRDGRGI